MAFELIEAAQSRSVTLAFGQRPHLVALVRAGATFHRGKRSSNAPTATEEVMVA